VGEAMTMLEYAAKLANDNLRGIPPTAKEMAEAGLLPGETITVAAILRDVVEPGDDAQILQAIEDSKLFSSRVAEDEEWDALANRFRLRSLRESQSAEIAKAAKELMDATEMLSCPACGNWPGETTGECKSCNQFSQTWIMLWSALHPNLGEYESKKRKVALKGRQ
jgi:hypothetical protein